MQLFNRCLTHSLCSCSKFSTSWINIFCCLSKAFGKCWKPDPLVAILGAASCWSSADMDEKRCFVWNGAYKKEKLILRVWKMDSVHTFDLWLEEMVNTLHLQWLRFRNEDRGNVFSKIWDPLLRSSSWQRLMLCLNCTIRLSVHTCVYSFCFSPLMKTAFISFFCLLLNLFFFLFIKKKD